MSFTRQDVLKGAAGLAAVIASGGAEVHAFSERRSAPRRTVIRNVDILSMDPVVGLLAGTDVLIEGDRIAAIGRRLPVTDVNAEFIDGRGKVLMPGMVDGHRHVWEGFGAGRVSKISRRADYTAWKLKAMVCLTPDDARLIQYAGGLQAINAGVTSVLDYCHIFHTPELAEQAARGLVESGIAGVFCHQISHTPTYGPGETLPLSQAMMERSAPADDAHWAIARHLRDTVFSGEAAGLIKFGLAGSVQDDRTLSEQLSEVRRMRNLEPFLISQHYGRRSPLPATDRYREIRQLADAALLGPDYHVAHGTGMLDDEIILLRDAGSMVCATTLGEMNYPNPSIHGRAREMGLPVGLGVDVPAAFSDDYFEIVRSAYFNLFRTEQGRALAGAYSGEDILDMATHTGARAIRHGDVTGSITVGKRADLVLLDTDRIGFPVFGTLADRVANYATGADIDSVWVGGVARKRRGRMVGVDLKAIKARLDEVAERVEDLSRTINLVPDAEVRA